MPTKQQQQPRANSSSLPLASSSGHELSFLYRAGEGIHVEMIDGEPWFLAKDVCAILGLVNPWKAVGDLADYQRLTSLVVRSGSSKNQHITEGKVAFQKREVNFVNESGLYTLIFQSRKAEAKEFQRWVTTRVLPSIRKYGVYCVGFERLSRYDIAGVPCYLYSDVRRALGYSNSGSLYKRAVRYPHLYFKFADRWFVSCAYAPVLALGRNYAQLKMSLQMAQKGGSHA